MRDETGFGLPDQARCEQLEKKLVECTHQLQTATEALRRETEQHRHVEEALQKSQARLLTLFAVATDIILVLDGNGRYVDIAPTSAKNLFLPPEELTGKTVHEVLPGGEADRFVEQIHRVLQERQTVEYEYMLRIGTREVWFDSRISPLSADTVSWVARDVTTHKQVEARLQEYEKAVEGLEEMMVIVDREYRYRMANRAFLKYHGMGSDQLIGRHLAEVLNPAVFEEAVKKRLDECFQGEVVRYEISYDYPDRGTRDLSISYYPIQGHSGIDRVACVLQDVTELRKANESLKLLKSAVEQTDEIIFMTDVDGRFNFVNPAFEEIYGYSKDETIGNTPRILKSGIGEAARHDLLWATILAGKPYRGEYANKAKDGRLVYVDSAINPVFDANHHVVGFIAVQEDKSAQRVSEERTRKTEEQLRLIAENVTDLIAVLDQKGKRVYCSPSFRQLQLDPESLKGTNAFDEIHPEDRERTQQGFSETLRTGIARRADYRHLLKDGAIRHIESQLSSIRDRTGEITGVVVVSRDVTERKLLEQQFLRAQRLENIGTLASGIAHDLNNVLGPILMSVDLVRRRTTDPEGLKWLDLIATLSTRGTHIVKQILGFGRGVGGERILIQPRYVLNELIKIIEETFPKSIAIRGFTPKKLWAVVGDMTQLHQVFLNICVNARDAMPNGGTLTIAAENVRFDGQSASMHAEASAGDFVAVTITDSGTGIPLDIRERIFEPFFTTKGAGKGTGLGLSTALAIVRSHGGFIDVSSDPDKGTSFKILLPADVSGQSALPEEADRRAPGGHGELILVIDDEVSYREATQETLRAAGYQAIVAANGANGVGLLAKHRGDVKAVITDMIMPIMDGKATIRALKTLQPEIIIIGVSGLPKSSLAISVAEAGAQAFLEKPYSAYDLLKILHEVLMGSPPTSLHRGQ